MPVQIHKPDVLLYEATHSPVEITLRRVDGSHATYTWPHPLRPDPALEERILRRVQDEIQHGAEIVQ